MKDNRFAKNARLTRLKALCFTLVFHFVIIGSAFYGASGGEAKDFIPDFVKEYFEDKIEKPQPEKKEKVEGKRDQA